MTNRLLIAASLMWLASPVLGQITIDGTVDAGLYGTALSTDGLGGPAVQNTRTQFGDGSGNPDPIITGSELASDGGSEINQVFGAVADGRLNVLIAGNLEGNFNKLVVFIDAVENSSGVNTIDGSALPTGVDSFCCGGLDAADGALQRMNGLAFDDGFNADALLVFTHGRENVGKNDGDYNQDGTINIADYTVWRDNLGAPDPLENDPNPGPVGQAAYDTWKEQFGSKGRSEFWALSAHYADLTNGAGGDRSGLGMQLAPRGEPKVLRAGEDGLDGFPFVPSGNPGNSDDLLSDFDLADLEQGELIDRDYVQTSGGCVGDTGLGCDAREFEFALDIADVAGDPTNSRNHRRFNNIVDLRMALNNSNTAGVRGNSGESLADFELVTDVDDPEAVETGIEFSIPLDEIGASAGGGDIRITAFINNNNFEFASNQFAGDGLVFDASDGNGVLVGDATNLGGALWTTNGARTLSLNENELDGDGFPIGILGRQYVTVVNSTSALGSLSTNVPEPSTWALMAAGAMAFATLRRGRS